MKRTEAQQDSPKRLTELCKESSALHKKIVDLVLSGPVYDLTYNPFMKDYQNEKHRHKKN